MTKAMVSSDGGADSGASTASDNGWPLPRSERTWGGGSVFTASVATAVATWCFIIGGYVSYYLQAGPGTIAMIAGSLIGIFFIALACVPVTAKYGFDTVTSTVPQLGVRGKYLAVALIYMATIGWNIYLIVLLGRSVVAIAGAVDISLPGWSVGLIGVLAVALVVLILRKGADSVRDFTRLIAAVVILLAISVIVLIIRDTGWSNLMSLPATAPYDDEKANWASGLEVLISVNLSWWAYTAAIARNGPRARSSLWPVVFALGLGVGLGSLAGFFGGLVVPDSAGDPTLFVVDLGGTVFGIVALGFVVVSSFGTTTVGMYSATLALRQLPWMKGLSWRLSTVVAAIPAVILAGFFPNPVFDNFSVFLAFLAVAFAPMCGIQIVDYFLLRKQHYDIESIYDPSPRSTYWFVGGVNPVAIVSFALGVVTYLYLLDPVSYIFRSPFEYFTASIPTLIVTALAYYLGTLALYTRRGRFGYRSVQPV